MLIFKIIFEEFKIFWMEAILGGPRTWRPLLVSKTVSVKFHLKKWNTENCDQLLTSSRLPIYCSFGRADAGNTNYRQGCKHLTQAICTVSKLRNIFYVRIKWISVVDIGQVQIVKLYMQSNLIFSQNYLPSIL